MLKKQLYILFISVLALLFMFSCEDEKGSYTVKGKLENVNDSIFFAARETTGGVLLVDTIAINNKGEFSFSGTIDTLTILSLYFRERTASPYILVDKGWNVEVSGDINLPDLILGKGGNINDDLTKFKVQNTNHLKSRVGAMTQNEGTPKDVDSIATKEHAIELKNNNFELMNVVSEYVTSNPSKIASVILINSFFKNEEAIERLNDGLDELEGVAYDFSLAVQLREYRDKVKKSAVDSYAPVFSRKDMNDKDFSLAQMRGQYILLSFVSTTCGVCQEMLPDVVREYDKIKKDKKNIEFVSIVKDVEDVPLVAAERKEVKWLTIPEHGGWASPLFEDYNIKELPYSILISPEGKILERDVSIYNLNSKLDTYPNIKSK